LKEILEKDPTERWITGSNDARLYGGPVSDLISGHSQRLLQIGVGLFLFTSFWGFFISMLPSPQLGRSVHTLAALQGVMFIGLGLLWPKLRLRVIGARAAFWLLLYSSAAILAAFVLASLWHAGNETMPLAANGAHGSAFQESVIRWIAYSSAPTGIASFALILWGLR
jgi:hydroxylaminobenzene mutase